MKQTCTIHKKPPTWILGMIHLAAAIVIFSCLFMLLNQKPLKNYAIRQYEGTIAHREPVWTLKQGAQILDTQLTLPAFMPLETGKIYSITAPITYDASLDRVPFGFFYSHHLYCRAFLDGQVVFSYMPEDLQKRDNAKSPGNIYAAFPVPENCVGKQFTIEFLPPLTGTVEYELPCPVFGDYPTEAFHAFQKDLPHNVIGVFALFLGVGSVLFASLALKGSEYREGIYIGIFALLFSIYNLTECTFNFYAISNPYYTYTTNYMTFSLIPVFFIAFLRERLDSKQKTVGSIMLALSSMIFILELILHFSGILDMREFLPVLHIAYFTEITLVFILVGTMKQKRFKRQLILQMVPILIGMILDTAVYYKHWRISGSDAAFTTIGVVIFLIIELYHAWSYSIEVYTESVRSQEYQKMAYVDALTGVGNRRAFESVREQILSGKISFESLCICSVDVNDLKQVNDNQGHAAGDFLIRNAADVLKDLAGDSGQVYRVGGDEFSVLLYNLKEPAFLNQFQAMENQIQSVNCNSEVKLSLAIGWNLMEDGNFDAAFQNADRRMYENKAAMKAARIK